MGTLPYFFAIRTDAGRERDNNQDSVGECLLDDGRLVVVADGMGGHQAGDLASQITVRELLAHVSSTVGEDPRERLYIGIEKAHSEVLAQANQSGTVGMGSTVVACFVADRDVYVAHVGDSRLYLLRDGVVAWMTRDHTRIRFLVDAGFLSEAEAENHPEGNVITRAVGHDPADIDTGFVVDVRNIPLKVREGDSLLLCSDGLYDMVGEAEIVSLVSGRNASSAVDALIDRANATDRYGNEPGGQDNISVAIVHFGVDRGASLEVVEQDTLETPTDPIGEYSAQGGAGRDPSGDSPSIYQPQRSTLVPEPTLEDETVTLPVEEAMDAPVDDGDRGTVEMLRPNLDDPPASPSKTLEMHRLRLTNGLLWGAIAVLLLFVALAIVYLWRGV